VDDWLLFLHVLSAFLLMVTVVMYSAVAFGGTLGGRATFIADRCWDVGGLGTLILGVWLALKLDEYGIFDGWIIGALVLWFVATGLGQTVRQRLEEGREGTAGDGTVATGAVNTLHWLRTLTVLALLVLMIWKPGA
jgi:hypothetical protein